LKGRAVSPTTFSYPRRGRSIGVKIRGDGHAGA
jgi:hypothetical protein